MIEFDVSRAPRGVLAAQQLIAAVAERGDMAERHYLELKSTLNLATKKDKEKIAKFILGAANRMPDVAATAFEGYGIMIIGVAEGAVTGIPPVEVMEISKVVQQYVGAAGPRWDVIWAPIDGATNQVLLIVVDPPVLGQAPFPCRANGESLTDGRIYIRADGETREAKADEFDLLVARGNTGTSADVDFGFEVVGEVFPISLDADALVDEYVSGVRNRLESALAITDLDNAATRTFPITALSGLSAVQSALDSVSAITGATIEPEKRTEEEYLDSIDRWEAHFRTAWDEAVPKIKASQLQPAVVKITNRTNTFFQGVQVKLHLASDIYALDYREPKYADSFDDLDLPLPPRKWGPTRRPLSIMQNYANMGHVFTPSPPPRLYVPPSISYKNGGSVDLELDVGDLRPRASYESEAEELVLFVADESITNIDGKWELTARGHNDVYAGDVTIELDAVRDLNPVARRLLRLTGDAENS